MSNECKSKHPDKAWFCENPAFHPGDHRTYSGWGASMKTHTWPRTDQSDGDDGHDGWCGCERCEPNQSDGWCVMNLRVLKGSSLAFAMPDGTTITWQARSNDCLPENQSKLTGHRSMSEYEGGVVDWSECNGRGALWAEITDQSVRGEK